MFGSLGMPEMLFILGLALLIFGPKRLPELGRTIGRAMGEFRRASTDLRRTFNNELALEEEAPRRPARASSSAPPEATIAEPTIAESTIAAPVPAAHSEPRSSEAGDVAAEEAAAEGVEPTSPDDPDPSQAPEPERP